MLLKGSLLALLIASVCADDHPISGGTPNTNRSPDNSDFDDVGSTVTYPNRRYGAGKGTQVSSSAWGSGRARTGRVRKKAARRRRWGRPARTRTGNNSRVKPSGTTWGAAQESYRSGRASDTGYYNTDAPTVTPTTESYNDSYNNDHDEYQNDYDGYENDNDGYQNDYDEEQYDHDGYDKDYESYQVCTRVSISMHALLLVIK